MPSKAKDFTAIVENPDLANMASESKSDCSRGADSLFA